MNEQVREDIKKIIYDTCNSMRLDYPAGWDKIAGEGVDQIAALWPKPLDVEVCE